MSGQTLSNTVLLGGGCCNGRLTLSNEGPASLLSAEKIYELLILKSNEFESIKSNLILGKLLREALDSYFKFNQITIYCFSRHVSDQVIISNAKIKFIIVIVNQRLESVL